jgi:hypothetical protein
MNIIDRLLGIFGRGLSLFGLILVVSWIGVFALYHQEHQASVPTYIVSSFAPAFFLGALLTGIAYSSIPLTATINWLISKGHLWPLHATPWVVFVGTVAFLAWFFAKVIYPAGYPSLRSVLSTFTITLGIVSCILICALTVMMSKINNPRTLAFQRWMIGLEPGNFR